MSNLIKIEDKIIGDGYPCFIIAEAGVNHNGKLKLAYKLVDLAEKCGADFVKFQTSIPELHISKIAKMANYQIRNTQKKETQLEMIKKISS